MKLDRLGPGRYYRFGALVICRINYQHGGDLRIYPSGCRYLYLLPLSAFASLACQYRSLIGRRVTCDAANVEAQGRVTYGVPPAAPGWVFSRSQVNTSSAF